MKKLLLAAALLGMAACANTQKSAVGSAEGANAPTTPAAGECCAEKAGECTDMKAAAPGAVCPVTGKPASN